jgi:hypothetical protein
MAARSIVPRLNGRARLSYSLKLLLGMLEKGMLLKQYESQQPRLFILGLPRSGTTLLYQYLVHRLRVSYFTNRAGHYYFSPCLATLLQRESLDGYYSDFQSRYGKVQGPLAPREAGALWGRFFSFEDMSPQSVAALQNTTACIQHIFGDLPFVNKNVKHMLRIDALSKVFPNAYFLIVERELTQVAISVLRGRYTNLQDPTQWWSVRPPDYSELKDLPVIEQIAGQLLSLQERMDSDLLNISTQRVIRLKYESFCYTPEGIVDQLKDALGGIESRNAPVKGFEPSNKLPQNDEETQLVDLVMQYETT